MTLPPFPVRSLSCVLSARGLHRTVSAPWGLRQPEPFFDRTVKIHQLALSADTLRSPFQPDDERSTAKQSLPTPKKKDAVTEPKSAPAADSPKPATPVGSNSVVAAST